MPPTRVGANASGRRSTRAPIVGSGQRVEQGSESASSEWAPRCLRPTAWPGHSSRGHRRHAVFDMAAETLPAFARTTWLRLIGVMVRPTLRGRGRGGSPASSTRVPNAGCGPGLLIMSATGSSTRTSMASDMSSGPSSRLGAGIRRDSRGPCGPSHLRCQSLREVVTLDAAHAPTRTPADRCRTSIRPGGGTGRDGSRPGRGSEPGPGSDVGSAARVEFHITWIERDRAHDRHRGLDGGGPP